VKHGRLDSHRESICSCLFNKVVPAYLDDLEFKRIKCDNIHGGNPDMLMIVVNDAAEELKRFIHWRRIINAKFLIDKLGNKNPAIFSDSLRSDPGIRVGVEIGGRH
jgi:hypothetical protein